MVISNEESYRSKNLGGFINAMIFLEKNPNSSLDNVILDFFK
jgi:hypothetical protein